MRKLHFDGSRAIAVALVLGLVAACQPGGDAAPGNPAPEGDDAVPAPEAAEPSAPESPTELSVEPSVRIVADDELAPALETLRGEGLLLNFWAIWCEPCVAELPELVGVAREFADRGGRVALVSFDLMVPGEDLTTIEDTMRAFLTKHGIDLPVLVYDHVDYEAINARYDLPGGIPVTLAIDGSGAIVDRHTGKAGEERFEEMMRKALGVAPN